MKSFLITEQEIQSILNCLGECPAKIVINAIDILRRLPAKEEQKLDKE